MSNGDLLDGLAQYDLGSASVALLTPETHKLVVAQST